MRRLAAVVVAVAVALAGVDGAGGQWSGLASGEARGAASTLRAGNRPTAAVNPPTGTTVALTWPASTGGAPVAGYEVRAYDAASGTPRAVGGSCAGLVTGTSCSDTGAPTGTWRYSVTPRQQAWAGAESPRSDPVLVDPTPPMVAFTFPAAGGSYGATTWNNGCTSSVCGTAADNLTVASVAVSVRRASTSLYWDGSAFASATEVLLPATGTASWRLAFPAGNFPAAGGYTTRAVATDGAGGTASVSRSFTIDPLAPSLVITFPANGGAYTNLAWDTGCALAICGTASDNVGVTQVFVSVRRDSTGLWWNGSSFASSTIVLMGAAGTTNWNRSFSSLNFPAEGQYTVRALARDAAGNSTVVSHTFYIDRNPPTAAFTFPANGATYDDAAWDAGCAASICGTASDAGSFVTGVQVSIRRGLLGPYWNGTSFSSLLEVWLPATGTTEWTLPFAAANFPANGSYTVNVRATDAAGQTPLLPTTATFTFQR